MSGPGYEALWLWFGLSRASFLTLPRVLMHEMPDKWQADMSRLLNEFDAEFPNKPDIGTSVSFTRRGKFVQAPRWALNYRHPNQDAINALRSKD